MKKFLTVASFIVAMFVMTGCESMSDPSPLDTNASGGAGSSSALGGGNLVDNGDGLADGLKDRGVDGLPFDPENLNPEDIVSTIYFGFNQYAVAPSERENVKKAADFFKANPNVKVYLVGHTDWYGTEEYNVLLSDKRCKAVQEYMVGSGLNAGSIETVARGEQGSVVDVAKDSSEAKKDRRVDIVKVRK
ncbi:MAG: hypothetical protein E7035_02100 [Verrucomicrobiaceae bacterium]|nr:hypothetical protein [Verrucomicrobiaceae bacterium]